MPISLLPGVVAEQNGVYPQDVSSPEVGTASLEPAGLVRGLCVPALSQHPRCCPPRATPHPQLALPGEPACSSENPPGASLLCPTGAGGQHPGPACPHPGRVAAVQALVAEGQGAHCEPARVQAACGSGPVGPGCLPRCWSCVAFLAAALPRLSHVLCPPVLTWTRCSVCSGAAVTELVCAAPKRRPCAHRRPPIPLLCPAPGSTGPHPVSGFASSACFIYMQSHVWSTVGLGLNTVSCVHPCCSVSVLHPWLRPRIALLSGWMPLWP